MSKRHEGVTRCQKITVDFDQLDNLQRFLARTSHRGASATGVKATSVEQAFDHAILGGAAAVGGKLAATMRAGVGEGEVTASRLDYRQWAAINDDPGQSLRADLF